MGLAGARRRPARGPGVRAVDDPSAALGRAWPGEAESMSVPVSQMWTVASYVVKQKLKGVTRYPLVLMLEPLFRCNLACAGCGKIQYPAHILKKQLSVEQCLV